MAGDHEELAPADISVWIDGNSAIEEAVDGSGRSMREVARLQPGGRVTIVDVCRVADLLALGRDGHATLYVRRTR
jgi:hypothetical protein